MTNPRLATMLALAATTLVTGGCGSSSGGGLTSAQLATKANAICVRLAAEKSARPAAASQPDIAHLASQIASYERAALAELRALTPPSSMAGDWKKILADAQTLTNDTSELGRYAQAQDFKSERSLVIASQPAREDMLALANRDGWTHCAGWTLGKNQ